MLILHFTSACSLDLPFADFFHQSLVLCSDIFFVGEGKVYSNPMRNSSPTLNPNNQPNPN